VGRPPDWENVIIASGHYRNGIMLAPITAQIVADLVTRGTTDVAGAEEIAPSRLSDG
jgi:glycine/D-amino acid oxidase-like deaminating enzyme